MREGRKLFGRRAERQALDNLLAGARDGRSAVIVLRGEAGIGKTELLRYLLDRSTGCRVVRAAGVLPLALLLRAANRGYVGELSDAESLAAEAVAVGDATGTGFLAPYGALFVEPWRGREGPTYRAMESLNQNVFTRGQPKVLADTQWAAAVLYNGLGRYGEAQAAARRGSENPDGLGLSIKALPELVEASARLRRLGETGIGMDLARARLCYGEWLRRENRRTEACAELGARARTVERVRR